MQRRIRREQPRFVARRLAVLPAVLDLALPTPTCTLSHDNRGPPFLVYVADQNFRRRRCEVGRGRRSGAARAGWHSMPIVGRCCRRGRAPAYSRRARCKTGLGNLPEHVVTRNDKKGLVEKACAVKANAASRRCAIITTVAQNTLAIVEVENHAPWRPGPTVDPVSPRATLTSV